MPPVGQFLPVVTGGPIDINQFQPAILTELAHRSTNPYPIGKLSHRTMPWGSVARLGIQQTNRYLVSTDRLVDRKPQMVWEGVFDGPGKGLFRQVSRNVT